MLTSMVFASFTVETQPKLRVPVSRQRHSPHEGVLPLPPVQTYAVVAPVHRRSGMANYA